MNTYKRILTVQDISCVGQCSLTVALPILSACGLETAILPSAVLSTHTGGFKGFTFRDLTEDIPLIENHWKKENLTFAALYTGYLGSAKQIAYVRSLADRVLEAGAPLIADPAMADNGKLYPGFDAAFVEGVERYVGPYTSRADHGHMYPVPRILGLQRFEETVEGELGRTVRTPERESEPSCDGGGHCDVAAPGGNHPRQYGTGDGHWGEIVDFHYLAHHFHGSVLDSCPLADAGVGKEDIDALHAGPCLRDEVFDPVRFLKVIWKHSHIRSSAPQAFFRHGIKLFLRG